MKIKLLAATLLAALASAASADIVVNMGSHLLGGTGTTSFPTITGVTGTLTGFSISVGFAPDEDAMNGGSWASDGALLINGIQWGGYDDVLGSTSIAGGWSYQGFGSADPDTYTSTQTNIGLVGNPATYDLTFGNDYFSSTPVQYNDITVTLFGVVPTPGAAALLGLGGLSLARRRR